MGVYDSFLEQWFAEPQDIKDAKRFQEDLSDAIYFVDLALKKNDREMLMKYSSIYKQLVYEA